MDPATTLIMTTSVLALVSTSANLFAIISKLSRSISSSLQKLHRLEAEVNVLRRIVDECYQILRGHVDAPQHVRESLISCFESEEDVARLLDRLKVKADGNRWKHFVAASRAFWRDDEITKNAAVFRESVVLLRDLCSEIKLRHQFTDTSAAMARLMDLSEQSFAATQQEFEHLQQKMTTARAIGEDLDHPLQSMESRGDGDLNDVHSVRPSHGANQEPAPFVHSTVAEINTTLVKQAQAIAQRKNEFRQQFASLEASNYIVEATVVVENLQKTGGQRFSHIPAEIEYYPGRVKLDTGSEADLASLNYLLQAGLALESLTPIPQSQQAQVEGIGRAKYTPKFEVELKWFRHGESVTNKLRFLVVGQAPFDLLLSSRRFAPEPARQLVSLPLVRRRKPRELISQELQEEKKRIQAARDLEEQEFQDELKRRRPIGRVSTT